MWRNRSCFGAAPSPVGADSAARLAVRVAGWTPPLGGGMRVGDGDGGCRLAEPEQIAQPVAEEADEPPQGRRGDDRDDDAAETRQREEDERRHADAPRDEPRD